LNAGDKPFLKEYYSVRRGAARFLLELRLQDCLPAVK
jgi:hypothetical protein